MAKTLPTPQMTYEELHAAYLEQQKGNRTVIDDTHKAHGAWRETESGEIDE